MNVLVHPANTRGYVDLGWIRIHQGFHLRKPPAPGRDRFGALVNLDHGFLLPGNAGFGMHGHQDMEIITVMISGTMSHQDDFGNKGKLTDQQVQLISSGTGIKHDERNASDNQPIELLQIWIEPRAKGLEPKYQRIDSTQEQRRGRMQLIVSPDGADNSLKINQDAWFWRGTMPAGTQLKAAAKLPTNGLYLLVISGGVSVKGEPLLSRDAIAASGANPALSVFVDQASDLLLIDVPVHSL